MNRFKVRKYLKIRWDISFRRKFAIKSEDEQLHYLVETSRHLAGLAEQCRHIQSIAEMSGIKLSTST